ncbi:hypothetical protein CLV49_1499 [Labedella gwakjiensis]|uniref:Uncharacterized protein n=1 Tax=Labedella gwakjiensis TaxID=390269 RepID=A0A2P8GVA3_9MICO|nr:hypothetical protein [Labedella gwakjiensis]PSL37891.1 hypothetical protein CLV49_1499 [Labedella gwakjiensis]RUQ87539.1 hypothetical protein ELQ93_11705 [Labedella gwakjiensis]
MTLQTVRYTGAREVPAIRTGLAVVLFGLGIAITCVRFPPADAAGWIAQSLHVPLGVPFLIAALLFGSAAWLLGTSGTRFRALRFIALVAAAVSALIGVLAVAAFV